MSVIPKNYNFLTLSSPKTEKAEAFGRKPIEEFCLYAGKKQTTIKVNKDTFEATFEKATNWLMKQHKITPDYEIRVELAKRKKYYWVDKL